MPHVVPVLKLGSFKPALANAQAKTFSTNVHSAPSSSFEGILDHNAAAANDRVAQASGHNDASVSRPKNSPPPAAKAADHKPASSARSSAKADDKDKAGDKANDTSADGADTDGNSVQTANGNRENKTGKADKENDTAGDAKDAQDVKAEDNSIDSAAEQLANTTTQATDPNAGAAAVIVPVTVAATPDPKTAKTDATEVAEAANAVAATAAEQATNAATATDTADANKIDETDAAGTKDTTKTASTASVASDKTGTAAIIASNTTEDDTDEAQAASALTTEAVASDDDALANQDKTKKTDTKVTADNQKVGAKPAQSASTAESINKANSSLPTAGKLAEASALSETDKAQSTTQDAQTTSDTSVKAHGPSPDIAATRADANQLNTAVNDVPSQNLTPPPQPITGIAAPTATQATATVSAQEPAVPLAGVPIAIANKASEGKNHFEIRLDPPELGRIEVHLDVDRDGRITSHVMADRNDTLDLLRRDSSGLERALQDAGLKTSDNGLQFSLRNHSNGQEQRQNGANTAHLVIQDETLPASDISTQTYGRMITPSGGLDIRV